MTPDQEHQEKFEEMYQRLTHAVMLGWQSERRLREAGKFPGLDSMITTKQHCMEASVKLELSELKWLESQTWRLRRIFLDQTDVLNQGGKTAFVLVTVETILEKVLCAFSEKYLDQRDEDRLSFLTSGKGAFDGWWQRRCGDDEEMRCNR